MMLLLLSFEYKKIAEDEEKRNGRKRKK